MSHEVDQAWARLDLQRFECVAQARISALDAQGRYAQKCMDLIEQSVKIEKDRTELEILNDKFARFKAERHAVIAKRALAERRLKEIERHSRWLRKLSLGEFLPQSQTTFVWSAFYFFMDDLREPDLPIPRGARAADNFAHDPPFDKPIPDYVVTPWAFVLFLRQFNLRPRCGSAAMQFLQHLAEHMVTEAEQQEAGLIELNESTQQKIDTIIERGV